MAEIFECGCCCRGANEDQNSECAVEGDGLLEVDWAGVAEAGDCCAWKGSTRRRVREIVLISIFVGRGRDGERCCGWVDDSVTRGEELIRFEEG